MGHVSKIIFSDGDRAKQPYDKHNHMESSGIQSSMIVADGKADYLLHKYGKGDVLDIGSSINTLRAPKGGSVKTLDLKSADYLYDLSFDTLEELYTSKDTVTAFEVFEHLENPWHAMREIEKVLKPGGVLIISIPNPFHIISRLLFLKRGDMPRWTKRNNHITVYTKAILHKLFQNFDHIATEYYVGELTYGFFKHFDGKYPENEWFGHFIIFILEKK